MAYSDAYLNRVAKSSADVEDILTELGPKPTGYMAARTTDVAHLTSSTSTTLSSVSGLAVTLVNDTAGFTYHRLEALVIYDGPVAARDVKIAVVPNVDTGSGTSTVTGIFTGFDTSLAATHSNQQWQSGVAPTGLALGSNGTTDFTARFTGIVALPATTTVTVAITMALNDGGAAATLNVLAGSFLAASAFL